MNAKPAPRPLKKSVSYKFCIVCAKPRSLPMRTAQLCDVCMANTALAVEALSANVERLSMQWGALADALTESDQHRFGKMLEVWQDTKHGTTLDQATKHYRFKQRLVQTVAEATPFTELVHAWWEYVIRSEEQTTLAIQLVVMADDEVVK